MKIKYEFVTETVEVEVEDSLGSVIVDLDRQEYNNNHTETRRHCSFEELDLDNNLIPSDEDIEGDYVKKEDIEALREAVSKLSIPHQRLIRAIFFEGISVTEYGRLCGITQEAASQQKKTALKKLKKLLEKSL